MSIVKELVDEYESGREVESANYRTKKRILLVDPDDGTYDGWRTDPAVPKFGDAYPGDPSLTVVTREAEGYGPPDPASTSILKYSLAKVTITYSTNTLNNFTLASGDLAGEILTLQGVLQTSGEEVQICVPINIDTLVIPVRSITRPVDAIHAHMNRINDGAWRPFDYMYAAGTVLFEGCPWELVWDPDAGAVIYQLNYRFKINPWGWNYWPNPNTGQLEVWSPGYTAVSFAGFPP